MEKNYSQRGGDFVEFLQTICNENQLPFVNEKQAIELIRNNDIEFHYES